MKAQEVVLVNMKRKMGARDELEKGKTDSVSDASVQTKKCLDDSLTTENKKLDSRLVDTQTLLDKKIKDFSKLKGENNNLRQEVDTLKNHEEVLRKMVDHRDKIAEEAQTKLKECENSASDASVGLEIIINKRFDKIEESIDKLITKKLTENKIHVEQIGAKIDGAINKKQTFADSVTGTNAANSLAIAIRYSKNEEIVQEREREKRSSNLIIYGMSEISEGDPKVHDRDFVYSFLDTIGVAMRPKQIIRLGKANADKKRPVKLMMENDDDKNTIMSRL